MNEIQKGIVALLKSAITGEKQPLPETFDIGEAYPVIQAHKIAAMAYEGALCCGIPQKDPTMQKLMQMYLRALQLSSRQMKALEKLYAAFDEAGFDYMPLKGSIMKAYYRKPELRIMGDADILIRAEQYDKVALLMQELGFRLEQELDYEYTWLSDGLHLELHKALYTREYEDLYAYYGSGWSFAKVKTGTRYAMTDEDSFIYMFAHFAKHFRHAGIGCRHVVDLWVYLRNHPALDEQYIETELDKLHLREFHQNTRKTIELWFGNGQTDPKSETITEMVFSSGNWGNSTTAALSAEKYKKSRFGLNPSGRLTYILRRVFWDKERMRITYPVLRKAPWVYPFVWLHYIISKLLKPNTSIKRHGEILRSLTAEKYDSRKKMLDFVGFHVEK